MQGLFLSLSRIIWAFHIQSGVDANGKEIEVDYSMDSYTDSENMRPRPFQARFTPRDEDIKQLILEQAEDAREALRVYDGESKLAAPYWID